MLSWFFSGRHRAKSPSPRRRRTNVLSSTSSHLTAQRGLRYEPLEERAMFAIDAASDTPSFTLSQNEIVVEYGSGEHVIRGFANFIATDTSGPAENWAYAVFEHIDWDRGITLSIKPSPWLIEPTIDITTGDLTFALRPGARGEFKMNMEIHRATPSGIGIFSGELQPKFAITVAPDWHNLDNPSDVNGDELITEADLQIVAEAMATQSGHLPQRDLNDQRFIDVNGDNVLSSIDLLLVAEKLNARSPAAAVPTINTEEHRLKESDSYGYSTTLVGMDDAGRRVVVTVGDSGVVGQRYDATGAAVGESFTIAGYDPWTRSLRLVMNGRGDFVLTWKQNGRILARGYSVDGTATNVLQVDPDASTGVVGETLDVGIAADGNFTIVWDKHPQPGNLKLLLMQRYSANGSKLGGIVTVSDSSSPWQVDPSIAMNAAGEFVVAWQEYPATANEATQIWARRFNDQGEAIGAAFRVDTNDNERAVGPLAAINESGEFVVGWSTYAVERKMPYGELVSLNVMRFQRFDAQGLAQGAQIEMHLETSSYRPWGLVLDDRGNFVTAWSQGSDPIRKADLYLRRFDSYSETLGAVERVNAHAGEVQTDFVPHSLVMNGHGQYLLVWAEIDYELTHFPPPSDPYMPNIVIPHMQIRAKGFDAIAGHENMIEIDEDQTLVRNIAQGLLGTEAVAAGIKVDLVANSTHGRLELIGDGSFTYTPAQDYFGEDSFSYVIVDGNERSTPIKIRLRIKPVNDAPIVETSVDVIKISGNAGPQRIAGWLKEVTPGPANEASQDYTMLWTWTAPRVPYFGFGNDDNFVSPPHIDRVSGDLTFELLPVRAGVFTVVVTVFDSAGRSTEKPLTIIVDSAWQNQWNAHDVDGDGRVGNADLAALDQALATLGEGPLPDLRPVDAPWLDLNGDASLTVADRQQLQSYLDGAPYFVFFN